jgi:hypothetical protein
LVREIQAILPARMVSAADHSITAGRDVNIAASAGGVAAGVIHGNVAPAGPTPAGPGRGLAGPGIGVVEPGGIAAAHGGVAIGRIEYQRASMHGQPVRLASRPPLLAGREELLAELDTRLWGGDSSAPQMVVLCGLGGAGKTSVAVEYAYRHLAEVGVAWQFAAEDPTVLAAGFGELAAQLGARDVLDTRDPVASAQRVLAVFPAKWLLVFDNAPDRASVEAFLPPAGRGQVLITSQNQNWPRGQALQVPVLSTEVAAGFLVDRTGDPDQQAAEELAEELGRLPLALEQAAAYLQATGVSLAGYLAWFRQRKPDLLGRGEPTGYRGTVATTWALAFTRLEHAAPGAPGLLRLLAGCAPEAIPLRLLLQPRPELTGRLSPQVAAVLVPLLEDELAAKDAIAGLRRYSLISPAIDGSVSVHRLVQVVTAAQMPTGLAEAWRNATAAVIEAALPPDAAQPSTWPDFAALLPHAQAALAADSKAMERIGSYLGHSGNYLAARDLYHSMVDAQVRVRGPEHPNTLAAESDLAFWTGLAGDPAAARDQMTALVPVRERVSGPEHPQTLAARINLARWTGAAGDPATARDQFAALLPTCERVSGPEHPQTLAARLLLARWTGLAGDPAAARDQFASLLPIRERVSGVGHLDTLSMRTDLAYWTGEAGNLAAARDLFAALLPVSEQTLGPEHPDTLTARHEHAHWTGRARDPAAARDLFASLLPVSEQTLGPEHPQTLAVRHSLAYWTGHAGNASAARDQCLPLLSMRERVLGAEHPDTLTTRHEHARWTGEAGNPAGARDLFAALLPVSEQTLGSEHPHTLATRHHLARWTGEAGDAAAARDLYAALLPLRERVLGLENPATLATRANLARWTRKAGGETE